MKKRQPKPTTAPPPADWRQVAEAAGTAAFEAATTTVEPPAPAPWWESPKKGKEVKQ